jgi:hypothetical protein
MGTEATRRQQVAAEAERILRDTRHTYYTHNMHVDVTTGTYNMDCSELVDYVLEQVAPLHLANIPKETSQPRQRAFEYQVHFGASTGSRTPCAATSSRGASGRSSRTRIRGTS